MASDTAHTCVPEDFKVAAGESSEVSHAVYADLRQRCPVAHTDALGGFWALTRYDDVASAAANYAAFTTTVQNVVPKVAFTGRRPPLHLDPPEQTVYRAALNPLLTATKVAALEPMIRAIVRETLAPLLASGEGDICEAFSIRFPVRVFSRWMNLPPHLEEQLMQAGPAFIRAVQGADNGTMRDTSLVLYDMARSLIALRRAEPMASDTDPVSALMAARANGQPLPDEMIIGTVRQVLVVGIVAPMIMVGNMAIHLAHDRSLHAQLKASPALIPAAVEEFLRLYTPYRGFARTPTQDTTVCGRHIAKDAPVALIYASANRDESVFEDASNFQLNRVNINDHLAFGRGPHYCAGANLARAELALALEELVSSTTRIEVTGPVLSAPFPEIGPWSVPVRLHLG